jgi:hypothetical protein
MQERPFLAGFLTALQTEAWNWTVFARQHWGVVDLAAIEGGRLPKAGPLGQIGRFVTRPYPRLSFVGMSDAARRARHDFASQRRCDLDVTAYLERFEASIPRWNVIGRIGMPSLVRAWSSLRQGDFDREWTERVLAARELRASAGIWPTVDAASTVCEGVTWRHEATPDGALTIRASVKPFVADDPKRTWAALVRP